jgi:hypothetical protein
MTFCTLVEFEWDETFGRERFTSVIGDVGGDTPGGLLSRIVGIDDKGARVIEVWRSGDDAQAFAEQSRPFLAAAQMPAPSRVIGFEVTSYKVS